MRMNSKKIDDSVVKGAAHLARLNLTDDEIKAYGSQLNQIIGYMEELNRLDTKNVEPTSHVLKDVKNVFRKDEAKESLTPDEALQCAPKRIKDFFGVPKVIEE